jgi:HEAT repeat protein
MYFPRYCLAAIVLALAVAWSSPDMARADKREAPISPRRDTLEHLVDDLVKYLRSDSVYERQDAERELWDLGPKAIRALPALIELLKGDHLDKKLRACRVVGSIGPSAKAAVPSLAKVLSGPQHPDEDLHGWALHALGEIGPNAREALPALTKIMNDKKSPLRAEVAYAVFSISKDRAKVEPVLLDALNTPTTSKARGRYLAANYFRHHPAKSREVLATLVKIVDAPKEDGDVQAECAFALWLMVRHEKAIPALIDMLKTGRASFGVEEFLAEIGPPAKAAVPILTEKIKRAYLNPPKEGPPSSRRYRFGWFRLHIRCLGKFGPLAEKSVGTLLPLLKHKDLGVQLDAAVSLWKINKSSKALDLLQTTARHKSPYVSMYAINLLHEIGKTPKEASAAVVNYLKDEELEVRVKAAQLLKKIDPATAKKLKVD